MIYFHVHCFHRDGDIAGTDHGAFGIDTHPAETCCKCGKHQRLSSLRDGHAESIGP